MANVLRFFPAKARVIVALTFGTASLAGACSSQVDSQEPAQTSTSDLTGACGAAGAAALSWERNHLHDGTGYGCWSDMCGLFVYRAALFGANDVPTWLNEPAATADGMMHNAMNAGVLHGWDGSCPCGAILFYESHPNVPTGHVVMCNGDGTVSSSGWPGWPGSGECGFDGQTNVSLSWLSAAEGIPPTGYVVYGGSSTAGGGGGANPCAHVPANQNGLYCGTSTESGFGGGSPTTLYDCENGGVAGTQSCSDGCLVAPAGRADRCLADPCTRVSGVDDGLYCGTSNQSGFAGGNAHLVYDCENGRTASTKSCAKGCFVAPAGKNDGCH